MEDVLKEIIYLRSIINQEEEKEQPDIRKIFFYKNLISSLKEMYMMS